VRPPTNSEHLLREQTAEQILCRGFTFTNTFTAQRIYGMEYGTLKNTPNLADVFWILPYIKFSDGARGHKSHDTGVNIWQKRQNYIAT
jgi:hypothetical protein